MKNRLLSKTIQAAALMLAAQLFFAVPPARAQLDETCTVSINGQTVNVGFGGEFRLDNVSVGPNLVRAYAVCTKDGKTRYGRSGFFQVSTDRPFTLSELDMVFQDTPFPSTASIKAVADQNTLTTIGQTTQIRVIATLSDDTQKDVTQRGFGSTYLSSNSSVATVSQNGLVTAIGPGIALITANNDGATTAMRLTVAPPGLSTTVEGIVQNENGTPAVGAVVVVPGGGETVITEADGRFSVSGVYTRLGTLTVRAYNIVGNQLLLGVTGPLRVIIGGVTDAGIIVIKPLTNFVYWKTPVSGSWSDATKWSAGRTPTANDNVFIGVPGNVTVTFSTGSSTIKRLICDESLIISGGTAFTMTDSAEFTNTLTFSSSGQLVGSRKLEVSGQFIWSNGIISGAGPVAIAASGAMTINGAGTKTLSGATINNTGTVVWTDRGSITGSNSAVFNNLTGGLFDIQNDTTFVSQIPLVPYFNNSGTVRKSAGIASTVFNIPFNNTGGTVEVQSGMLGLFGGGKSTGGTFNVAGGASLIYSGANRHSLSGNYSGAIAGLAQLDGGIFQIDSSGATFNMTGGGFQMKRGTLSGPGTLTNTGILVWTGGTMDGPGTTNILTGSTLNISGTEVKFFRRTLNNTGRVIWSGTGNIASGNGAVFNNLAGGIFDIQNDASFSYNIGSFTSFNNFGTVTKSAGTGTSTFTGRITFNNNNGTINVMTGTLSLGGGGTSSGGGTSTGGNYIVASGATLDLTGGSTHTYSGTYTGSGAGTIQLNNGTLNIAAAGATFNFGENIFHWNSGNLSGTGLLTNQGKMNIGGGILGVNINNEGTVIWSGTGNITGANGAVFNNLAGGVFDIQNDARFFYGSVGSLPSFSNLGTVTKSAGTGTSTFDSRVAFNNHNGTINVLTGTLSLSGGGTSTGGNYNASSGATLDLTGNGSTHTYSGTYAGSGAGTIQLNNGTLNIAAAGAIFNFIENIFQWIGGRISGTGILANKGEINISGTVGVLLGGNINNEGTVIWSGTGSITGGSGAVFNNLAGGVFDIQNDAYFLSGPTTFSNFGTVTKSAGTGRSTFSGSVAFNNNGGTINVLTGTLSLDGGGTSTGGNYTASSGATLDLIGGGTHTYSGTYTGSGAGTIQLRSGILNIAAAGAIFNFSENIFHWIGGSISGTGTLTNKGKMTIGGGGTKNCTSMFNNSGTLAIESGIASFGNGFAQGTSNSNINLQIYGFSPGTGFAQHRTTGGITTLAGNLNVSLNNFTPAVELNFQVLTFVNRNNTQFANINLPALPAGRMWGQPVYTNTSLTIFVVAGGAER